MLFRLKGGKHIQDGKKYKKGDIIDTFIDLAKIFRGKFEKVSKEFVEEARASITTNPEIPLSVEDDAVVEPVKEQPESDFAEEESETLEEDAEVDYGKEITSEFPTAAEIEVKVYAKSNWCTVIDTRDNEVLNTKKLRKKNVEEFLQSYLPTDEE